MTTQKTTHKTAQKTEKLVEGLVEGWWKVYQNLDDHKMQNVIDKIICCSYMSGKW